MPILNGIGSGNNGKFWFYLDLFFCVKYRCLTTREMLKDIPALPTSHDHQEIQNGRCVKNLKNEITIALTSIYPEPFFEHYFHNSRS